MLVAFFCGSQGLTAKAQKLGCNSSSIIIVRKCTHTSETETSLSSISDDDDDDKFRLGPLACGQGSACHKATTYTGQHSTENHGHTSVPPAGSEPTIPVSEQSKTICASDQTAIGTGLSLQSFFN